MNKNILISPILLLLITSMFLMSCSTKTTTPKISVEKLEEIQMTACYSADASQNCNEMLSQSEIITSEECCNKFKKCCI